jgi:hypothetical protein
MESENQNCTQSLKELVVPWVWVWWCQDHNFAEENSTRLLQLQKQQDTKGQLKIFTSKGLIPIPRVPLGIVYNFDFHFP